MVPILCFLNYSVCVECSVIEWNWSDWSEWNWSMDSGIPGPTPDYRFRGIA